MKIGCILILYQPDQKLLRKNIEALVNQVDEIYVGDNSIDFYPETIDLIRKYENHIHYNSFNKNTGIATAQNAGINYFACKGFEYILFMDQDSIAPSNMVSEMLRHLNYLTEIGVKVGAIGPRPFNRQDDKKYVGLIKKGLRFNENLTEVTELISSASLIPTENFVKVGGMDDDLFIDGVDHEWCWRGTYKTGLRFFIAENVLLSHQFGEGDRFVLSKRITIPTPFRIYYRYRNYLILIRRNYVPNYWKLSNGVKYIAKFFYYPIFVRPRFEYFKQICMGISDGLKKRT